MFVLDEIDKILQNIASWGLRGQDAEKMRISLDDIERIDVNQLQLATKVRYSIDPPYNRYLEPRHEAPRIFSLDNEAPTSDKHLTSDYLFASLMSSLVLSKLTQIPERQYPSAKLIICDRPCYDMLIKLKRMAESGSNNLKNLIYKPPFGVTAIFLLSDIMDLFDRGQEPIVNIKYDRSAGKLLVNYNYSLIRQTFPYLKMSDLVILLLDKEQLQLGRFNLKAGREHQLLQLFNHFSRSTQLIELDPLTKLIGTPHIIYNNVLILQAAKDSRAVHEKLSLAHISFMADRLCQVAGKLRLDLRSISFRANDPYGQARVFTQLVSTSMASKEQSPITDTYRPVRVVVVDRSHDLQTPLLHADRYGAFLEQEMQARMLGSRMVKLRMDTVDELDERLQQDLLSEVVSTILRYALSLKNQQIEVGRGMHQQRPLPMVNKSLSSTMATSQSIKRHLDMIKLIYQCLNEGYLLVLRLETSLESISNRLRCLIEPLAPDEQVQLDERLQRILAAFKQLTKTSGNSITALDLVRTACIMLDVTNMFTFIHRKSSKILGEIRNYIFSADFKKALTSKLDSDDKIETSRGLIDKIRVYDRISQAKCAYKSTFSLEQILEKFYTMQLDKDLFPITNLTKSPDEGDIIILVSLGSLTPSELSRIKAIEATLKTSQKLRDIYILTSGIAEPASETLYLILKLNSIVLPVQGYVKNYHWGKTGNDSYIARFLSVSNQSSHPVDTKSIDQNKPLAELWFGSHPSGPSTIVVGNQLIKLDSFLAKQPEFIGNIEYYHKYNKKLPFLFKILSIAQPLSLQAHPDKKLAEVLHKRDPKNYPDSNHKPELAIALTEFEVLCDFRPAKEILHFMKVLPSFGKLVGGEKNNGQGTQKIALAQCFKSLMTTDAETIAKGVKSLLSSPETTCLVDKDLLNLIIELDKLYPGDPGVFAPFFLNYFKLIPGQAVYLKANKLHAYIRGECIECMACSDNVVRAGLTSKYRDVDTLLGMLDYKTVKDSHDILFTGLIRDGDQSLISYSPTDEFKVDKIIINQKNAPNGEYNLPCLTSGSFIIVLLGKASTRDFFDYKIEHKLISGTSGFIPPKISLRLYNIQGTLTIYRSYCQL